MINFKPKGKKEKIFFGMLIGITVSFLTILMVRAAVFEPYELKTFDRIMRHLSKKTGSQDMVIVEIDQSSLDSLKQQLITWPWPRQVYSPVIGFLSRAGSKAIFFDILFTEASSYGKEDDERFGKSIREAGNVYMPFFLSSEKKPDEEIEKLFIEKYSLKVNGAAEKMSGDFGSVVLPIPEIVQSAKGMGNVQMPPDPDGIYRRLPLLFKYKDRWFSHMGISYLSNAAGGNINIKGNSIQVAGKSIPCENGLFILKYYGGYKYYNSYPVAGLIESYNEIESGKPPKLSPELFRDKYVFIGLTAPGLFDLKPSPVASRYPGVMVHATLFDNILREDYLIRIGRPTLFIFIIIISILSSFMVIITRSLLRNLVYFFVTALSILLISVLSFKSNLMLDTVSPLFSFGMSFAVSAAFSYSTEGKKRRQVKQLFSLYMNESLVNELLKEPENLSLGGEKKVLTVFFSDLKSFTSISEKKSPEEIVGLLNVYLTAMTEIILNRGGIIDKYQGDGIMAFWGAPIKKADDEVQACFAALENQKMLLGMKDSLREMGFSDVSARIGLNTGEMIVGNMGSERRFDYTVIGDNVNLASRLESANKVYSTKIIASEATYLRVRDHLEFRDLDIIRVKGKEEHIHIYELMGEKGRLSDKETKLRDLFEEGISFYRKMNWTEALERFYRCLELNENDGPSIEYLRRCKELLEKPPTDAWDGVFVMESK